MLEGVVIGYVSVAFMFSSLLLIDAGGLAVASSRVSINFLLRLANDCIDFLYRYDLP